MGQSEQTPAQSFTGSAIGIVLLVGVWAQLASGRAELVLPSPAETINSLGTLFDEGVIVSALATTLRRAGDGVLIGLGVGLIWGSMSGISNWFAAITRPILSALMALPPIVIVAVGLVWFGPGGSTTRLVVTLVALPLIVIAVQEAVRSVDGDLIEMGQVFDLSRSATIRHVVAPGIASPVLAATSVALSQSLRVTVMAELLSAGDGIGAEIALARTNLATSDLFAWAIVLVSVVVAIELVVIRPLTAHLLRWRSS